MSKKNLNHFSELVLNNTNLQDQLKNLSEREEFIARLIELGAENCFEISREDVENQLRENRRLWHERWI